MDIAKGMPYSLEAEQATLGSMILSSDALSKVMEMSVSEKDFYLEHHKVIFDALNALYTSNTPVDIVTLSGSLAEKLDTVGGVSYIGELVKGVNTTENIKYYVDIVKKKSVLRRLIDASGEITSMCYDESEDVAEILDSAEQKIFSILQGRQSQNFTHVSEILPQTMKNIEKLRENGGKLPGISSGFKGLDNITSGFQRSDLIVLAARPGVGKTAFALNIAAKAASSSGLPVAVFALEMSKEQLVNRLLCSQALIPSEKIRTGNIGRDDMGHLAQALGKIVKLPIYIDDSPIITASEMRAKCRRLKLEKGLGMIIIDYLQLMRSGSKKSDNRQTEVAEMTRSIKIMAKELDVPVLLLSQLSRATEQRSDKRPILSDLRESGAIEQDADIVMFLHRKTGDDVMPDEQNRAQCIIEKHRSGATGSVDLAWRGEYTLFTDFDSGR